MKNLFVFFFAFLMVHFVSAQKDLKKCSEQKNNIMTDMAMGRIPRDSSTLKKIGDLDKEWQSCVAGKTAPHFKITTFSGEKINTDKLAGKILIVNFWFIECAPCMAELPALNKVVSEYKNENIRFLAITFEDKATVKNKFLSKSAFDFDIISDGQSVNDLFGVGIYPTTFIIDQKGNIAKAWSGGETGPEAAEQAYKNIKPVLDELLKTGSH